MTRVHYEVPKEDNWYKYMGQKPPERFPHLTDDEREDLMERNISRHRCNWYQNGAYLVCDTDEFEHGKKIPTGMLFDKEATERTGKVQFRKYGAIMRDMVK